MGFLFGEGMGYFKQETHFLNYIKKGFRDEGAEFDGRLTIPLLKFYKWSSQYNKLDAVNRFTWDYKHRMSTISANGLEEYKTTYLRDLPNYSGIDLDSFSDDFIKYVIEAGCIPGCYALYDCSGAIAYVGKSIDLSSRVLTSLKNRDQFSNITDVAIIHCKAKADISILEAHLIASMKPYLNRDQMTDDLPTIELANVPEMTHLISIFKEF